MSSSTRVGKAAVLRNSPSALCIHMHTHADVKEGTGEKINEWSCFCMSLLQLAQLLLCSWTDSLCVQRDAPLRPLSLFSFLPCPGLSFPKGASASPFATEAKHCGVLGSLSSPFHCSFGAELGRSWQQPLDPCTSRAPGPFLLLLSRPVALLQLLCSIKRRK